jgi:hypothetical protein
MLIPVFASIAYNENSKKKGTSTLTRCKLVNYVKGRNAAFMP